MGVFVKSKKGLAMAFVTLLAVSMVGCGTSKPSNSADSTPNQQAKTGTGGKIDEIKKNGKLVIATGNYYPFEFHEPGTNKLVGYDIDLGAKIGEKIGVPVEWKEMQFTALIPTMQNKQADMIIAAMYITDERKKVIDFSNSYMDTGIVLVKKKANNNIKGPDDLKGKTVGVKAGAASEKVAQGLVDKGINVTIKSYKDTTDYLMDLELGRIDAALNDYLNQLGFNKQHANSSLEIVGDTFGKSSLGIGVNKGDNDLLNVVNEVIQDLAKNGEDKKLFEKWLK